MDLETGQILAERAGGSRLAHKVRLASASSQAESRVKSVPSQRPGGSGSREEAAPLPQQDPVLPLRKVLVGLEGISSHRDSPLKVLGALSQEVGVLGVAVGMAGPSRGSWKKKS